MKQKKYIILIIASLFMLGSCKKQLDLQPTDSFNEANAFLSMADVQQGAYGAYIRYGNSYLSDMYVSALLSDEAKLGAGNAGQGALTYRYQYGSDGTSGTDVIAAFGTYYAVIDQVNRVLPHIATVTAAPVDEPRRNILKGQLLALRGIAHFGLLQSYSKVYDPADPLGVPVMTVSDPLGKPARNSTVQVMAEIETDLANAKALLPAVTAATFSDTVINKINIAAYQARVALYKRDYDAAVTYSTEVIASGIKPLVSGAAFAGIWTDANTNEVLFRIRYTDNTVGSLWTTVGGAIYVAPSDKLVASYSASDIRLPAYIGNAGGNNYVNKFYMSGLGGRIVSMKAARTAEMYLIRAEANARKATPDITAAAADINLLRSMRTTGYTNQVFATATDAINAVMDERFKELAFEGFRFFDLKRNNLPVQRLASDANAAWQTLPVGSTRFVLPIPASELLVNPNMVQISGY